MQIQNSERFFVIGLSCIVDNGLCSQAAGTTSFASIADVLNERGIKSFQLREFDGDDGRPGKTVTFTGRNIRPLGSLDSRPGTARRAGEMLRINVLGLASI